MLQIAFIRENVELVKERLKMVRNFDASEIIDAAIDADKKRRQTQQKLDALLNESKQLSSQIGALYKQGKTDEANAIKVKTTDLKQETKQLEEDMNTAAASLHDLLVKLPNFPHPSVPKGSTDEDNMVVKEVGALPVLDKAVLPHWELLEKYQMMSLELGTKIAGAGFPVFMGRGAKLQRALVAYFLDCAAKAGYTEYIPPLMINEATAYGTGQLPDKEGQMYYIEKDDLYMIPTAEVPITNVWRDEIVKMNQLPIKMAGHSQCFRREAGSYGAHVRGLNRVHQFEKVEVIQIVHPDKSYEVLDKMVEHVGSILESLGLSYRILRLCGGDLGFTSALTYDFEVFSAAQGRWLEVSSVSNFETFQSNRMKIRFKDENKKTRLCHTLNGSALALPRIIAALLENNQTPEGIVIPEVLRPYTGFDLIA